MDVASQNIPKRFAWLRRWLSSIAFHNSIAICYYHHQYKIIIKTMIPMMTIIMMQDIFETIYFAACEASCHLPYVSMGRDQIMQSCSCLAAKKQGSFHRKNTERMKNAFKKTEGKVMWFWFRIQYMQRKRLIFLILRNSGAKVRSKLPPNGLQLLR